MLLLAVLFVILIIALAFYVNSVLDRREEKRVSKGQPDRREPM